MIGDSLGDFHCYLHQDKLVNLVLELPDEPLVQLHDLIAVLDLRKLDVSFQCNSQLMPEP